jgi:hypothetical protein
MTDEEIVKRAKEAEKRTGFGELVHSPISKGVNSAYGIGFIEGMVEYRNSLQEEPVSENLEKAAVEAFKQIVDSDKNSFLEIFKAGANWKKEQIEEALLSEVLPCFMHGGEADEVMAKLDEVLTKRED